MKRKNYLLLFCLFSFTFFSCEKDNEIIEQDETNEQSMHTASDGMLKSLNTCEIPRALSTPLRLFYHGSRTDHFTSADSRGDLDAMIVGYQFQQEEGWISTVPAPSNGDNMKELKLYWHSGRKDNYLTSDAWGENNAITSGYVFVRSLGYIWEDPAADRVPLKLYWSSSKKDNMTVARTIPTAASHPGYTYVRTEGYVTNYPFVPNDWYMNGNGFEMLHYGTDYTIVPDIYKYDLWPTYQKVMRVPMRSLYESEANTALLQMWTSLTSTDIVLLTSGITGYAPIFDPYGYIFTTQYRGTYPLNTYYNSSTGDYLSVMEPYWSPGSSYQFVRTEGYVLVEGYDNSQNDYISSPFEEYDPSCYD